MSAEVVKLTIVVSELEGGVRLREALLFPEVVACDTRHARQLKALRHALRQAGFQVLGVGAAHKVLTADYLAGQLSVHVPPLTRAYGALARALPAGLRQRPIPINIGEFTAFARRPA